jgi:MFS family permease
VFAFLQPKLTISEYDLRSGLRALTAQGTVMMGFDAITSGGFMAAYALALGASNSQIGILAALPFLLQPLQIPSIAVVERFRKRKQISFFTIVLANAIWLPAALIPFLIDAPGTLAITTLLVFVAFRSAVTPFFNVPWMSWMKDLVPSQQRGSFFAKRLQYATALGMALGLGGAVFADVWKDQASNPSAVAQGFAYPILAATLTLGIAGWYFVAKLPESVMPAPPEGPKQSLLSAVTEPIRDPSYKYLIRFKFLSTFAMQLAIPFFAVYMIQVIGLPVTVVMGFTALSQLANIGFLGAWGRMVDRFGAKPILSASVSLYLLVILGWTFTTIPDKHVMTLPMLGVLHILAGVATAGMNVTQGTIAMKLAPEGKSTSYLAASSLAISLGAALGPLAGGLFADFFSDRSFRVALEFVHGADITSFTPFYLGGFDFLFAISFVFGLLTLGVLAVVKEEGEVTHDEVMAELMGPMRGMTRTMSSVPGVTSLVNLPFDTARRSAVPGLDVAVGVTAYQVAEAARVAAHAAETIARGARRARSETETMAKNMLLASISSANTVEEDGRRVIRGSIRTLMRTLGISRKSALDAAYGAGYGVLEAAQASGLDAETAARHAIDAARESVNDVPGVTPEEAVAEVTQGMIDATDSKSGEHADTVRRVAAEALNNNRMSPIPDEFGPRDQD